jgi:hypothetical protein
MLTPPGIPVSAKLIRVKLGKREANSADSITAENLLANSLQALYGQEYCVLECDAAPFFKVPPKR